MIDIVDIHHVSLVVTDLERARAFYRDVLGLREIERPGFDFPGAWFAIGERQLHLIVHRGRALRGTKSIDSRDGHFALRVRNFDWMRRHLDELDIDFVARPVNRTPWAQLFLTDPDGNVIELNAERDS